MMSVRRRGQVLPVEIWKHEKRGTGERVKVTIARKFPPAPGSRAAVDHASGNDPFFAHLTAGIAIWGSGIATHGLSKF